MMPPAIFRSTKPLMAGIVALGFVLAACGPHQAAPPPGGGLPVQIITLEETSVSEAVNYQGTLISRHSVSLQPQVAGQVAAIYVKAGDHVAAGTPLILLDPRKQSATVNASKADAEAFRAAIAQANDNLHTYQVQRAGLESSVAFNKQQLDRYTGLFQKDAASRQTVEQYRDALTKAQSDLNANAAQVQAQRSGVVAAQKNYARSVSAIGEQVEQLRYFKITAPYAGVVGDIPVRVGNYVLPSTLLLSVTQNNPLEININLPTERLFEMHNGLLVEVLDNNGKTVGSSRISFISPRVDTDSQTILIKAILENPSDSLKADQSANMRVTYSRHQGITVPTGAISHFGGQDFVFKVMDCSMPVPKGVGPASPPPAACTQGKGAETLYAKQIPVTTGELQGDRYVVLKGLRDNDRIVGAGIQKLMDGAPISDISKMGPPPQKPAGH